MQHDLGIINNIDKDFSCCSKSSVDSSVLLRGRPYGGTALLWRSGLFTRADIIPCDSDRVIAVRLTQCDRSILVFCVYMPINNVENLPEFTNCLALVSAVIEDADDECVLIMGDFNAHPNTLFGNELMDFCNERALIWLDIDKLDSNTYTFVSQANGACRWLDHCLVTEAAASLVTNVRVNHLVTASDHFPLIIDCNFGFIKSKKACDCSIDNSFQPSKKYIWGKREREQSLRYSEICDKNLCDIINKYENIFKTMKCIKNDYVCNDKQHHEIINIIYSDIVRKLQSAAECTSELKRKRKHTRIIGWNYHVRRSHLKARETFSFWIQHGRPRSGYHYENMTAARREYKAALKYVLKNQEKIKMDMLARHRADNNFVDFWKETKKLEHKIKLPINVGGQTDKNLIANLFRKHFDVKNQISSTEKIRASRDSEPIHVKILSKDIESILRSMKRGKSPGHDGLSIEHLLFAGRHICSVLAWFFNLCLGHKFLPEELIRTLVVPVVKNRTGDISSVGNYRPISLATVMAKVLERVVYSFTTLVQIDAGQFGFRPQLSTDMPIFALKEIVQYYKRNKTTVYACFLDLSRAFDTINHSILWQKMHGSGVPPEIVCLLEYWYDNQTNNVRWDSEVSEDYQLSCGVRQGGVTSPDLFNIYVNDLIVELSSTPVGLRLDGRYVNNLSYADDMVLISPSIKGLQKLLATCEKYANDHDLVYNSKKTEMMIFRSGRGPEYIPAVYLNGQSITIVDKFKYLGHIVTSDLTDKEDIERQRRALCVIGNMIARRFFRAAPDVRITLFKSFCQSFYTCQLWTNYTLVSHNGIRVAYNNIFRHLMGLERYCSASEMFTDWHVDSFNAIQRKRIASFMTRVGKCKNEIIKSLSDRLLLSATYRRWVAIAT